MPRVPLFRTHYLEPVTPRHLLSKADWRDRVHNLIHKAKLHDHEFFKMYGVRRKNAEQLMSKNASLEIIKMAFSAAKFQKYWNRKYPSFVNQVHQTIDRNLKKNTQMTQRYHYPQPKFDFHIDRAKRLHRAGNRITLAQNKKVDSLYRNVE